MESSKLARILSASVVLLASGSLVRAQETAQSPPTDLGALPGNNGGFSGAVNSKGQVVGYFVVSGRTEPLFRHPFLWENGGPMVDLNTLIPTNSGLELVTADNINERGEIVGVGVPGRCFPNFCGHLFLLVPCAAADTEGCADNGEGTNATQTKSAPVVNSPTTSPQRSEAPKERVGAWRTQMASRYHIARRGTPRE